MRKHRLTTVETDRRIELPADLSSQWLPPDAEACLVEIVGRGCLFVTSLEARAAQDGVTAKELRARLADGGEAAEAAPELPRICLGGVTKRGRKSRRAYTLNLPELALWYLFEQGHGPLGPKGSRTSAPVLALNTGRGLFLWAEQGKGFLR